MDAEATGRLLSLVSHELRTPANVVSGYLRMLVQRLGPLTDAQRQVVEQADRATTRFTRLLADLSELARYEEGRTGWRSDPIDLHLLVARVVSEFTPPPDTACVVRVDGHFTRRIVGDETMVHRALTACLQAVARTAPSADAIVVSVIDAHGEAGTRLLVAPDSMPPRDTTREVEGAPVDEFVGGLGLEIPLARRVLAVAGGRLDGLPGGHRALLLSFPPQS